MAGKFKEAQPLCTKSEWALVQECDTGAMAAMPLARVRRKAAAARRLRDKWRDLSIRQKRDAGDPAAAVRSKDKAGLFGEVHEIFQKHVDRLERAALKEAMLKRDRLLKKTNQAYPGKKKSPLAPKVKKDAAWPKKIGTPKKIQGHISSRNKRNQAKRDGR